MGTANMSTEMGVSHRWGPNDVSKISCTFFRNILDKVVYQREGEKRKQGTGTENAGVQQRRGAGVPRWWWRGTQGSNVQAQRTSRPGGAVSRVRGLPEL